MANFRIITKFFAHTMGLFMADQYFLEESFTGFVKCNYGWVENHLMEQSKSLGARLLRAGHILSPKVSSKINLFNFSLSPKLYYTE